MGKKHADSKKIPANGERWNCLNCDQPMQRWKHAPEWKPQPGKGWYLWWFECLNRDCRTRQVMPPGAYVKPGEEAPPDAESHDVEEAQRLAHFKSI